MKNWNETLQPFRMK